MFELLSSAFKVDAYCFRLKSFRAPCSHTAEFRLGSHARVDAMALEERTREAVAQICQLLKDGKELAKDSCLLDVLQQFREQRLKSALRRAYSSVGLDDSRLDQDNDALRCVLNKRANQMRVAKCRRGVGKAGVATETTCGSGGGKVPATGVAGSIGGGTATATATGVATATTTATTSSNLLAKMDFAQGVATLQVGGTAEVSSTFAPADPRKDGGSPTLAHFSCGWVRVRSLHWAAALALQAPRATVIDDGPMVRAVKVAKPRKRAPATQLNKRLGPRARAQARDLQDANGLTIGRVCMVEVHIMICFFVW